MEIIFEDRSLVIRDESVSALIISDLHIGIEEEIAEKKGVHFPYQHVSMSERIEELITKYMVSSIYILGDVKHTILADSHYNWEVIPEFMDSLHDIVDVVIVIPGNHDGNLQALLPRKTSLADVRGIVIGEGEERVGLLHGHAWPTPEMLDAKRIVIGHNHPVIRRFHYISSPETGREGRKRYAGSIPVVVNSQLKKNCVRQNLGMLDSLGDEYATLVTLPGFNPLITGVAVNAPSTEFQGPLFENSCVDFQNSEVYSTEGLFLGIIQWLRERFNEMIKSKPTRD
ncbi:MAG: metallophosphoesterase [Candidatus Thorarchaeota archaeon]|nr:metallophosphoesterase [Candidatus Thorarchaeota archaeon]